MNDTIHPDEFDVPHTIAVSLRSDEFDALARYATHHGLGPVEVVRQALDALYGMPGAALVDDEPEVEGDVPDLDPGMWKPYEAFGGPFKFPEPLAHMTMRRDMTVVVHEPAAFAVPETWRKVGEVDGESIYETGPRREYDPKIDVPLHITRHLEPTREMDTAVCATCGHGIHRLTGYASAEPATGRWYHDNVAAGFGVHNVEPADRRFWTISEHGDICVVAEPEQPAEPVVIEGGARRTLASGEHERADFGSPWATKGEFEALRAQVREQVQAVLDLAHAFDELRPAAQAAVNVTQIERDERATRREIERHIDTIGLDAALEALRWEATE